MPQHMITFGPVQLKGSVDISGSKNATLPILAASLLIGAPVTLKNVAKLEDIKALIFLLSSLGVQVTHRHKELTLDTRQAHSTNLCPHTAGKIRASVLLLGPMLARFHQIRLPQPGGCKIGKRPIDFHLYAMEKFGAEITYEENCVIAMAPNGLRAGHVRFALPSVTATENALMAAVSATGTSIIENASTDSEVLELVRFLKEAGYEIELENQTFTVQSSPNLSQKDLNFTIMSDRMELGTWIAAAGMTQGHLRLKHQGFTQMQPVLEHAKKVGLVIDQKEGELIVDAQSQPLKPQSFKTGFYPDFPTDLQAPFAALNAALSGSWSLEETIWENRFHHINEFKKFGLNSLDIQAHKVLQTAGDKTSLLGAEVSGRDLRGTCALALLSLTAHGTSIIQNSHHISRGYQYFTEKLSALGATVKQYNTTELSGNKYTLEKLTPVQRETSLKFNSSHYTFEKLS